MIYIIQFQEKPRAKWQTIKPANGIRGQIMAFDNRDMAKEKIRRLALYIEAVGTDGRRSKSTAGIQFRIKTVQL
jgi:hypothetical protein